MKRLAFRQQLQRGMKEMKQERKEQAQKRVMASLERQPTHAGESPMRLAATLDALTDTAGPVQSRDSVQHTQLLGQSDTSRQMPMDVNMHPQMPSVRLAAHPQKSPPRAAATAVKQRVYSHKISRESHDDEEDDSAVFAREAAEKSGILPSERRQKAKFKEAEEMVASRYAQSQEAEVRADNEERAAKTREILASKQAQQQVARQAAAHKAASASWQKTMSMADRAGTERGTKTAERRENTKEALKNVEVRKVAEVRMDADAAKARKREAVAAREDAVQVEHRRLARFRRKAEELVTKAADKQADQQLQQHAQQATVPPGATPGL